MSNFTPSIVLTKTATQNQDNPELADIKYQLDNDSLPLGQHMLYSQDAINQVKSQLDRATVAIGELFLTNSTLSQNLGTYASALQELQQSKLEVEANLAEAQALAKTLALEKREQEQKSEHTIADANKEAATWKFMIYDTLVNIYQPDEEAAKKLLSSIATLEGITDGNKDNMVNILIDMVKPATRI